MDKTTLFIVANSLWWLCGVFFGMGLQKALFQRKNRDINGNDGKYGGNYPLPVTNIEAPSDTEQFGEKRLLVVTGQENDGTIGVVIKRRDIDSSIPTGEIVSDARKNAQSITPNVK